MVMLTGCPTVNWGFVIAVVAAIILWFVISKTTLGYQLRAVGLSKSASEYGGISSSKIFMSSMAISGMLGGLGGAVHTLGMTGRISQFAGQESFGFDGITVALIAGSNPIGCIFSGLFYGAMKYGGNKLTLVNAPKEVVNIIMGTIIFFIAIALLFKRIMISVSEKKNNAVKTAKED
jgi:simple sugar transport system permease protein